MRQLLFVQGGGAGAHDEWDDKLVDSLARSLGPGYDIRYPRMPNEADPHYDIWKAALEREFALLDRDCVLVGHSIGATILVNALASGVRPKRLSSLFLVAAPFIGEGGWKSEDIAPIADIGARLPAGLPVHLYYGTDDETAPLAHLHLYAAAIPQATSRILKGRDHQLGNDLGIVAQDIASSEPRRSES
jgi:predicted alpha/beta hydrolase family esterase